VVEGQARGRTLRWQDIRLDRLTLDAVVAVSGEQRSEVDLQIRQLARGDTVIQRARANAAGTRGDHQLRLEAAGDPGRIDLRLTGALDGTDWRGRLSRAVLAPRDHDAWTLAEPARLAWQEGRARLDKACWRQGEARACVTAGGTPSDWRARVDADRVALAQLAPFGPPDLEYTGALNLRVEVAGGQGPVTGKARLDVTAGRIQAPVDDERRTVLAWEPSHAEATLRPTRIDALVQIPLADGGRVAATVGLGRGETAPLDGRIEARIDDPGLVAALTPAIGAIEGRLVADIELGGTLAEPGLSGTAELHKGRVGVVPLGIDLTDLRLALDSAGQGFAVEFSGRSGKGSLKARLRLSPGAEGGWRGEGSIQGERFQAVSLPEISVTVSPDLEWQVQQRTVRIQGNVVVPRARIEPRELAGAVRTSPDTVVVGEAQAPSAGGWRVFAEVGVTLGEAVRIDAFGLEGGLEGEIELTERPGRPTSATGELRVVDGEYTVYRQTLQIDRGRILFDGGPVADPGLDIRAIRRPRDVMVGVQVRETLRQPRATLFSEPPMPESQQLAYLIAGMPLGQASGEQQDTITAAAAALATSEQGAALASELGIDELKVDYGDDQQAGASLVLGRYLSPRLYVGYGVGLANEANSVRMRYELTPTWSLEAQSGSSTSADLLYSIETD